MNTIPHLLEWLKYKRLTVLNIGNYVDQLITLIHCWWEYKMIQLSENSLAVSYKDKHIFTHTLTQAFTYLSREIKMYVHKDSYRKVCNCFTHNSSKVETIQMVSINRKLDKS